MKKVQFKILNGHNIAVVNVEIVDMRPKFPFYIEVFDDTGEKQYSKVLPDIDAFISEFGTHAVMSVTKTLTDKIAEMQSE